MPQNKRKENGKSVEGGKKGKSAVGGGKADGKGKDGGKDKGGDEGSNILNIDLCVACERGNVDDVKRLLAQGAYENARVGDKKKAQCALQRACCNGHIGVAEILLENDADIDTKSSKGYTALHLTCMLGLKKIVTFLISKGANLAAVTSDHFGATPLHMACLAYSNGTKPKLGIEICEILLDNGASLDATTDEYKSTPLHHACYKNYKDLAVFLVSKGADLYQKDSCKKSPLDYAERYGFRDELKRSRPWMTRCLETLNNVFGYCLEEIKNLPETADMVAKEMITTGREEAIKQLEAKRDEAIKQLEDVTKL